MEKINLCEGIVAQMMSTEAWANVSGEFPFSESQLEKFQEKVDWDEISGNSNIMWTVSMLDKFKKNINWTKLSGNLQEHNMSIDLIEKFKDNWNWEELSQDSNLTPEIIDRFADYINWKALINNYWCERWCSEDFVKKYADRIPASEFKDSRIWREIVSAKQNEIKRLICLR